MAKKKYIYNYKYVRVVMPKDIKNKFVDKCENKSMGQSEVLLKFIHKFLNDEKI